MNIIKYIFSAATFTFIVLLFAPVSNAECTLVGYRDWCNDPVNPQYGSGVCLPEPIYDCGTPTLAPGQPGNPGGSCTTTGPWWCEGNGCGGSYTCDSCGACGACNPYSCDPGPAPTSPPPTPDQCAGSTTYACGCNNAGTYSCDACGNCGSCSIGACPPPTPTLYPTVVITGIVKEYSGVGLCNASISSDSVSINLIPDNAAGVTSACGITPPVGAVQSSYRCSITFNNQTASPQPNQDFTLSASATGYTSAYWTATNSCTVTGANTISVDVSGASPTTTFNKDMFFKTTAPWIKIKGNAYSRLGNFANIVPHTVNPFDSDDDGQRYVITGEGGLLTGSSIDIGTAQPSSKNWKSSVTKTNTLSPADYFAYVKSKKLYETHAINDLKQNTINLYTGSSLTIDASNASEILAKAPLLLMVNGDITVDSNFNLAPQKALTLLATGSIKIKSTVSEINGVFVANTVDFSYDADPTTVPLKVKGNLIVNSVGDFAKRTRADNTKPSVFIVFDPKQYVEMLRYISTSTYDWQAVR